MCRVNLAAGFNPLSSTDSSSLLFWRLIPESRIGPLRLHDAVNRRAALAQTVPVHLPKPRVAYGRARERSRVDP